MQEVNTFTELKLSSISVCKEVNGARQLLGYLEIEEEMPLLAMINAVFSFGGLSDFAPIDFSFILDEYSSPG